MEKSIPLYIRVKDEMAKHFAELEYYSPLPGERELCNMFHASRPTIRKALETLEANQAIVRIQGRGTFYIGNKVPIDYSDADNHGLGLFSVLSSAGKFTKSRVLQQNIEYPKPKVAAALNLKEDDMVFHLKRLRYVDNDLYSLADDYIPLRICPTLIDIDFTKQPLFQTLEEHQIIPVTEEKEIEIKKADAREAAYLNLTEKAPITVMRIISYDKDSNIIQYATSKSDAYKSRFKFTNTIPEKLTTTEDDSPID